MTGSSRTAPVAAPPAAPPRIEPRARDGLLPWPNRRVGSALVVFGVVGLILLAACLAAVAASVAPLLHGASALEQQRAAAVELIGPSADALESTADSAEHAGTSLGQSVGAAREAAGVTGQLADALQGLAAFSSAFADTANRSRSLSDDLSRTADALAQNQTDSATASSQLRSLADRLRQFAQRLGTADSPPTDTLAGIAIPLAIGLVALLLVWLGVIAAACIWFGLRMRRHRLDRPGLTATG